MIGDFIRQVSDAVWGLPLLALLTFGGLVLSKSAGFIQVTRLGAALKSALGGLFSRKGRDSGTVTPFEAVCTALAGTVGTGNITGVMVALTLGGPGAVFWMWVSAFIGMGTKYAEILLAVKYRETGPDGEKVGGPMYYIKNGLSKRWRLLAVMFCVCGAAAAFGIGNMMQMGSIVEAVGEAASLFCPVISEKTALKAATGLIMALTVMISVSGGAKSRGRTAAFVVPVMAAVYIIGALAVIAANIERLPAVLCTIIGEAFDKRALSGGAAGSAIVWGFRRGMLSHEAGLGSSPIAHASADTKTPVEQGFLGIFEVMCDTLIICTLTALMVLCSGVRIDYGIAGGAAYCVAALSTVFGRGASALFVAGSLTLFAFSSIVGWSLYGERCVVYLWGERAVTPYRAAFVSVVFLASLMEFSLIIDVSDILNAFMALPNMAALLLLAPIVKRETAAYFSARGRRTAA